MSVTDPEYWIELGRLAIACPKWEQRPGMVTKFPAHLEGLPLCQYDIDRLGGKFWLDREGVFREMMTGGCPLRSRWPNWYPDLQDAATVGALLALVRTAWGDPTISALCAYTDGGDWVVVGRGGIDEMDFPTAHTEAEILVAALAAAP